MNASTRTTKTWDILDASDAGEQAGQAPGATAREALMRFRADALAHRGDLEETPTGWVLTVGASVFVAEERDDSADLENGPHAADALGAAIEGTTDIRYTDEAIATMNAAQLELHLAERNAQRRACKVGMQRQHDILERLTDPDTRTYGDALANLGSITREHATLNRIIQQLEREHEKRRLANVAAIAADAHRPILDLINQEVAKRGLPCNVDETGDTELATRMWFDATVALEAQEDDDPTQGAVAARVADAYSVLNGYDAIRKPASAGDDAERLPELLANIDASSTHDVIASRRHARQLADALAVIILDPWTRGGLDPKALEQARRALGLTN